ncbi:hypothetical protein ACGFYQ_27065 [Streptomyces sp. NPDC048258]|uniref:hypothetical protein n=1 Tax=Streptomyces sp. NPDC048258 TaxID=3365527 RepID=UPI00371359EF
MSADVWWGGAGALVLLAAGLVAMGWAAGGVLPGLPRLRCDLPGPVFAAVIAGFGAGQVAAGLPLHLGPGQIVLLCGPWLLAGAVSAAAARRPGSRPGQVAAPLIALAGGFLVAGLTV